jgi:hypothetical protein
MASNSKVGAQADYKLGPRATRAAACMMHDDHGLRWALRGPTDPGKHSAAAADADEAQPTRGSRRPPGRQMSGRA